MPSSTEDACDGARRRAHGVGSRRWRRPWLRTTCATMPVLLGVVGGVERTSAVEVGPGALQAGRAIWGLVSPHRSNRAHRLTLNGVPLLLRSATVDASLEHVLAEAHRACAERASGATGLLEKLLLADGVLDLRGEEDGVVACFETGFAWPRLASALIRAAESRELGPLGRFRYLYARRELAGERVAVLSLTSEGPWDVLAAFPAEGDAPGADDPALPRPPAARRVLSAAHDGLGRSLVVYRAEQPLEQLANAYAAALRRGGAIVELFGVGSPGELLGEEASLWLVRTSGRSLVTLFEEQEHTWVVGLPALER